MISWFDTKYDGFIYIFSFSKLPLGNIQMERDCNSCAAGVADGLGICRHSAIAVRDFVKGNGAVSRSAIPFLMYFILLFNKLAVGDCA